MHLDRRDLISRTAAGALALSVAEQADAQASPVAAPSSKRGRSFHQGVVMLAEMKVRPERLEEFLAYTTANLAVSRSYPGNVAFDILLNEAEPDRVVFYEVWDSAADQKKYMAWRAQAGDVTKLLGFLTEPPRFIQLRSIAV